MPTLVHRHPKYRKHKVSGQALVTLNGKDIYLGRYGSKESRDEYDRVIAEWLVRRKQPDATTDLTVTELIADFLDYADRYYRRADGTPPAKRAKRRCSGKRVRPLSTFYGRTLALDLARRYDKLIGLNSSSDVSLKGNPIVRGD